MYYHLHVHDKQGLSDCVCCKVHASAQADQIVQVAHHGVTFSGHWINYFSVKCSHTSEDIRDLPKCFISDIDNQRLSDCVCSKACVPVHRLIRLCRLHIMGSPFQATGSSISLLTVKAMCSVT